MKRICIVLGIIFFMLTSFFARKNSFELKILRHSNNVNISNNEHISSKTSSASSENLTYAKVASNCYLFKDSSLTENIDNIYFVIPETYFVTIIETVSDKAYKVQYGNYIGYISIMNAEIATFIPIVKYLEGVTLDIKDSSGTQIWSKPTTTSNVLTTIPAGTKKINYIATAFGAVPSGGQSNKWYYVNFTPEYSATSVYEGYVYSENITNLTEIIANTECNPEIIFGTNLKDIALYISSPIKAVIIAIIAVPIILFFLIIIYKISRAFRESSDKKREKQKELEHHKRSEFHQSEYANSSNASPYFDDTYEEDSENYNDYNSHYNGNYNSNFDDNYGGYNYSPIKKEIQNITGKPFVRKMNPNSLKKRDKYPPFPYYESDDDLL